jgi:hypothetical protein
LTIKYAFVFGTTMGIWALFLYLLFFIILIWPTGAIYKFGRIELIKAFFSTLAAPFPEVTFKPFFVADVMCSMVKPF